MAVQVAIKDSDSLFAVAGELAGSDGLLPEELALVPKKKVDKVFAEEIRKGIAAGEDPLGCAYMRLNAKSDLRPGGETYTPSPIVRYMVEKAAGIRNPDRVVDCGCGSGRFVIEAALRFPDARIVAIDSSPTATLMAKASIRTLQLDGRIEVICDSFLTSNIPSLGDADSTLWIGNPPYVRHHGINAETKRWLESTVNELGLKPSKLAGLHAYFMAAIAKRMQKNDYGVLVTSAEWLDVNYGSFVRSLMVDRLGLLELLLTDKNHSRFEGVDTTSVIFSFDRRHIGGEVSVTIEKADGKTESGMVNPESLRRARRWSNCLMNSGQDLPSGYVRLGEYARVHRGIVTGANKFWVRSESQVDPRLSVPVVSHAKEIMGGFRSLDDLGGLSRLITLPEDVESLDGEKGEWARSILEQGFNEGVDKGYVASSRRKWWSIPVGEPAAILMTYMARKPPVFVANPKRVRSLNVVHGIYPKVKLSEKAIQNLVDYLNESVSCGSGRTYCGGLTKFEPKEAEDIVVPSPRMLEEGSWRS